MAHPYDFKLKPTEISLIRPGDVIDHNGRHQTVCRNDIQHSSLMGVTIFGDSYRLGTKPVSLVIIG